MSVEQLEVPNFSTIYASIILMLSRRYAHGSGPRRQYSQYTGFVCEDWCGDAVTADARELQIKVSLGGIWVECRTHLPCTKTQPPLR